MPHYELKFLCRYQVNEGHERVHELEGERLGNEGVLVGRFGAVVLPHR